MRYQEARGEYASLPLAEGTTPLQYLVRRDDSGSYPTFERTRPNGVVLEVRTVPLADGGFVRTLTDITHRRQAQEAAVRLASEDALTGLANRQQFKDELAKCAQRQQPSQSGSEDDGGFALLCLDVDWFKIVNETLGHWIGDGSATGRGRAPEGHGARGPRRGAARRRRVRRPVAAGRAPPSSPRRSPSAWSKR